MTGTSAGTWHSIDLSVRALFEMLMLILQSPLRADNGRYNRSAIGPEAVVQRFVTRAVL